MDGKSYDCFSQNKWTLGAQFYGTNNIRGAEKQSINKTKRSQFVVQASEQFYDELNNAGGRNMVQLKGRLQQGQENHYFPILEELQLGRNLCPKSSGCVHVKGLPY